MGHILVAEDSRISRRVVVRAIKAAGHEVVEACNGKEALDSYQQSRPICVVTDLLMPEMEGQELIWHIREKDKETPIIVCSADIQDSAKNECEEMGISAFLYKPVEGEDLRAAIESALTEYSGAQRHEA